MGRVGRALIWHELMERTRDRWVLTVSLLFALLAVGASLYGRSAEADANTLIGPSLVTLSSLLVPLVGLILGHDAIAGERERNTLGLLMSLPTHGAEVVVAKFLGRLLSLGLAVSLGLGAAILVSEAGQGIILGKLVLPSLLLGAAFLSVGILISSAVTRPVTAASLVIALWFLLVFFFDMGLLGMMVATDGALSQQTLVALIAANPAGLFRLTMMQQFAGPEVLSSLGVTVAPPGTALRALIWTAWIVLPLALSSILLTRRRI